MAEIPKTTHMLDTGRITSVMDLQTGESGLVIVKISLGQGVK